MTLIILNSMYFQIFLAMVLGALIGIERSFAGKTAGMRTYGLVAMGSCLFIVVSNLVIPMYDGLGFSVQPLQLAAGIITGIGFLCGGAIIFRDSHLSGLTTAAGLWVACGIGLAVGYKLYELATFTALVTLFNFTALWFIEHRITRMSPMKKEEC
jgi:putative Mg2+ transporter-C (MgtC) family protein